MTVKARLKGGRGKKYRRRRKEGKRKADYEGGGKKDGTKKERRKHRKEEDRSRKDIRMRNSKEVINERESATRFSTSGFFHESVSPKPVSFPLGPLRIFSKIRGYIRRSQLKVHLDTGVNI